MSRRSGGHEDLIGSAKRSTPGQPPGHAIGSHPFSLAKLLDFACKLRDLVRVGTQWNGQAEKEISLVEFTLQNGLFGPQQCLFTEALFPRAGLVLRTASELNSLPDDPPERLGR